MMQSRIFELIYLLYDHMQKQAFKVSSHNEMSERVIHFIKNNLTSDLSLSAMSKYTSFSPIHFHNCFKKSTGRTLREFAEEERIKKAVNLLVSTDKTLAQIACECGFSSQSYFSYVFKKKSGSTPREYAKKIQLRYENVK